MKYKAFYQESNEMAAERFELMTERMTQIAEQPDTAEQYAEFFKDTAAFFLLLADIYRKEEAGTLKGRSLEECEALNKALYEKIMPVSYATHYANPD